MKTVYLIRHAKSDWNTSAQTDFERPLNKRGKNDAPLIAEQLNQLDFKVDTMYISPAKRTTETTELIYRSLNNKPNNTKLINKLYHASLEDLSGLINDLSEAENSIAIVTHNPGITYFSNYLTDYYIDNIVTCGVVRIDLEIDSWQEVVKGIGTKKYYIYPKMFY